jgi:RNA polymerase sigma-70 factor (ECF subfamily)
MKLEKEEKWVDAFKKGEPQSIEKVITVYGTPLLRSAFLLCGNEVEAHDMVQETFFQAMKSIHRFKEKSSLFTWLYGILLNVFRQQTRKKRYSAFPGNFGERNSESGNNPEYNLERERAFSRVYSMIQTLSPHHREALILRYYEGLKIAEIAEITRVSEGTVKSRLHYATEALRKKMPSDPKLFSHSITHNKEKQ